MIPKKLRETWAFLFLEFQLVLWYIFLNMQFLLALLISLTSVSAFASKARIRALADSPHLVDPAAVYQRPLQINELENFATFESGITLPSGFSDGAEASLSYAFNDKSRWQVALGHQDPLIGSSRLLLSSMSGTAYPLMQNALNLLYGFKGEDTNYVMGVFTSKSDDKTAILSETSIGVSAGIQMGSLEFFGSYGASNVAESGVHKFDGSGSLVTNVYYNLDSTTFFLTWTRLPGRSETNGVENEMHTSQAVVLGVADSKLKDDYDFFWGTQVISRKIDCHARNTLECERSFTSTAVPAWFGMEVQLKPWLIFRGSVKQSFLIDQTRDEVGYPAAVISGANGAVSDFGSAANSTVVAMGLGLKFKNTLIDGLLKAATSQNITQNDFLTQLAITYNF